ncbi:hypothetical protein PJ985_11070 [Streptomyces sp. ACA25]|uniref:hypothetical protein n=1 Tax=Streptomyces sp. ACA25 TaxID=3022596 RepID=UPI002306E361|nr:hypothetical protein [Streptomyces sp. ACA25]MDB1088106.1 hypothetical protein [Streptomyces sp. ACA25]
MTVRESGYWCEFTVHPLVSGQDICLGQTWAGSPRLAVRWMRAQSARLAGALDPRPGQSPLPMDCLRAVPPEDSHPGAVFRGWLEDDAAQERELLSLTSGRRISVTGTDAQALYSVSARPLVVPVAALGDAPAPLAVRSSRPARPGAGVEHREPALGGSSGTGSGTGLMRRVSRVRRRH